MPKPYKKNTHGHVQCYNAGCRCDECKQANTERNYKSRKAREAKQLDPQDSRHGTDNLYTNFGCRCEPCTKAHTEDSRAYQKAYYKRNYVPKPKAPRYIPEHLDPNDVRHGTYNFYANYKCRCQPCSDANTIYERARHAKKKASAVGLVGECK